MLDFEIVWKFFGKIKKSGVSDQNFDNAKNRRAVFETDGFVIKKYFNFQSLKSGFNQLYDVFQGCHS